ncbi:hypothetical protein BJ508DRAFT_331340 [Ascobolus immersus RN42]|uniref:Uncharacterized protein n=1 Tax=Ascobolus immersus RN42 TaxID=1160509 RepID=A0A3N4HR35_ASCIM|nr:hypothetical protein BJ508DRAFT_331340 [Ascobolus immersus RN42]
MAIPPESAPDATIPASTQVALIPEFIKNCRPAQFAELGVIPLKNLLLADTAITDLLTFFLWDTGDNLYALEHGWKVELAMQSTDNQWTLYTLNSMLRSEEQLMVKRITEKEEGKTLNRMHEEYCWSMQNDPPVHPINDRRMFPLELWLHREIYGRLTDEELVEELDDFKEYPTHAVLFGLIREKGLSPSTWFGTRKVKKQRTKQTAHPFAPLSAASTLVPQTLRAVKDYFPDHIHASLEEAAAKYEVWKPISKEGADVEPASKEADEVKGEDMEWAKARAEDDDWEEEKYDWDDESEEDGRRPEYGEEFE